MQLEERDRVTKAIAVLKEAAPDQQSIGDLEAERVVIEKALEERTAAIEHFNLRQDYHDLEERLDRSDRLLHDLINENHSDRKLLQYYEESAAEVPSFDAGKPAEILADAGAIFRPEALRKLDEVAKFHEQVRQNRAVFLHDEIKRLEAQIERRDREVSSASEQKSGLLRLLSSSGALETLVELQRAATDLRVSLEQIKSKIDDRKRFDRRKDELTAVIGDSRKLLKQDLDDRRPLVDEVIGLFADYTRALYGVPGKLGVDVQDSGYRCTFAIDRQGSDGVDQMVVFCFDLMVAALRARRSGKFLTLIHDSSLFADVDPRQYGLALQLAAKVSAEEGFQYICCLNAGALPNEHLGELKLDEAISLRLTDDGDQGRLLGRRLKPRERVA